MLIEARCRWFRVADGKLQHGVCVCQTATKRCKTLHLACFPSRPDTEDTCLSDWPDSKAETSAEANASPSPRGQRQAHQELLIILLYISIVDVHEMDYDGTSKTLR